MTFFSLSSSARREVLVRASNLESVLRWVCTLQEPNATNSSLRESAENQISQARVLATGRGHVMQTVSAADIECADRYLDAAYVTVLRLAPSKYVDTLLTNILMHAQQHLPPNDPQLHHLQEVQAHNSQQKGSAPLHDRDRNAVIATLQASQEAARHEVGRVRNLRTVIIGVAAVTLLLAIGIGFFGLWKPGALPMCFAPQAELIVCPFTDQVAILDEANPVPRALRRAASPLDAFLILGVGLLGASLSAAAGLRQMTASHDPHSLQVTLAIAKLPIGAVTAYLGILLLRAEFVPGLSALDSSAQIIGWAIILGYAQQLFTGFVDRKAATLLEQASSAPEATKTVTPVVPRRRAAAAGTA